jgi:MoxR-like ATPase
VSWGAGPRASQTLVLAGKARALLHGRYHVSTEDIRSVAYPALRHRVLTNFNAEAEGVRPDDIIKMLIDATPRDAEDEKTAAALPKVFAQTK